ncbi:PREDICTED: uncharacterized protein LOC108970691 [Bactrocera latifrons]|uniref:Uncharacterized protein n=1 Tax=Bactrocera latifrons TaxID=174628 RepID=A0A0K8VDF3_BACLA|nr:PREDICTED: uncharacterized protein LOC108970691 [Bactrocera latifrons]
MGSLMRKCTTSNSNKSNSNANNSRNKASVGYQLFMYQEELRRGNTRGLSVAKSKISLTESLIRENVQNLNNRSDEDLRVISREMSFKKHLQKQVSRYSKLIKLAMGVERKAIKDSTSISSTAVHSRVK